MTTTTRVAVRAITSGTVGPDKHTEQWKIVEIPTDYLGDYDAEADAITGQSGIRFVGDIIVVDKGVEGFPAGCSTWARFSDVDDPEFEQGNEHAQAAHEHWNCEHTLFGSTPTEGWKQETDAKELDEYEAAEWWSFRTGPYAAGEYEAIAARYIWEPETWYLTVWRDEVGPLCERVEMESLDDARESGIATIVDAIEGF